MPQDLLDTVQHTLAAYGMLDEGERALVAVSGGADSIALLHLLHRAGRAGAVAHFDHQTRGGESGADAEFVARVARGLGLPLFHDSRPVEAMTAERGESFEMVAREARYSFLAATARDNAFTTVATGHHAGDQAETVLMRILRGTSPSGLAGIPAVRTEGAMRFIRPLIDCPRAAIVAWLEAEGIAWREDASNADPSYRRNRIRHELLPYLAAEYNPGIAGALHRLAGLQQADEALLCRLADEALDRCRDPAGRLDRARFRALDPALQGRCMAACILAAGGEATRACVARAMDATAEGEAGKQIDVGHGVTLYVAADHAVFAVEPTEPEAGELTLPVPGQLQGFGKTFRCAQLVGRPRVSLNAYCHAGRQVFDADTLNGELSVRPWRAGDRFQPLGMAGTRKLKEVFNDLGLARPERDQQLVVTCDGRIVWIVGHTISNPVAVTETSRNLIEITVE